MSKGPVVVTTLSVLFWVSTSQAQPPAGGDKPAAAPAPGGPPMEIPKPAPENDVIKRSAGTWRCAGSVQGPDGQEMKYKSTWTVKPMFGGHWYSLVYKRAKMGPMPAFEGNATVGYNTAEKKYVLVGFDSFGSWIDLSSADGAVYSGQGGPMGKVTPVKFSFSPGKDKDGKESDRMFDVAMDFGGSAGSESCKK